MKLLFMFAILIFLISRCFSQTCVIAKICYQKNDTSIVIGADTKFGNYTYNTRKNTIDTTYTHGHKIFNRGKVTYVTIGYGADIQRRLADSILNLHLSIDSTFRFYSNQFKKLLTIDLEDLKKHSPVLYRQMVAGETSIISSTIFAVFILDKPYLCHFLFIKDPFKVTCWWQQREIAAGGELQAIQTKLDDENAWEQGELNTIKKMLKAESIDRPDKVGLPFDFIIIHKNKVEQFTNRKY